jgi:hypothetical protein
MPLFFIAHNYRGKLLGFHQIPTPKTVCECCGQAIPAPSVGSTAVFQLGVYSYILASYGKYWHTFWDKEQALGWVASIQPFYSSTTAPSLDEFLVMTEEEHKAYITPTAEQVARTKRYHLREALRVWKLIGFAPQFPSTQEAEIFNCKTDFEWRQFKERFDRKYGKAA